MSYKYGGYPVRARLDAAAARKLGLDAARYRDTDSIIIMEADHPAFAGTGLKAGQSWGAAQEVLGVELDGVPLGTNNGPDPDVREEFPADLRILARASSFNANRWSANGRSHLGLSNIGIFVDTRPFEGGGRVISFGSIGYAKAVYAGEPIATRIFINAVRYLLSQGIAPPTVVNRRRRDVDSVTR